MAPLFEPVAPITLRALLIPLTLLLVWAFAAAFAHSAVVVTRTLFGTVSSSISWIPWLGHKAAHGLENVSERIAHWFGGIAAKADHRVAMAYHDLADLARATYDAILDGAHATLQLGQYMNHRVRPWVIHNTLGRLTKAEKVTSAQTKALRDGLTHEHNVLHNRRSGPIPAAIHEGLAPVASRTTGLEKTAHAYSHALPLPNAQALPGEVADIRARVKEAERVVGRLWDRVRGVDKVLTGLGAVALVASMVGKLGGGWIFCRNWRSVGRGVCRLPGHFIDDLLGLVTDFLVLTNICTILPWLESAASEIGAPMISALSKAGAGLCHGSEGPLADLTPPALHLPASGGLPTLHLP